MGVNLITCDNLLDAFKALAANLSDEDRAYLCQHLKCENDLNDLISVVKPNMLSVAEDGLLRVEPTKADDLVSDVEGNALVINGDGKLYVPVPHVDAESLLSHDLGNIIIVGKDGGLYARVEPTSPEDLISEDANNAVTLGTDDRLFVPKPEEVDPKSLISEDADNAIVPGSDEKLFAPKVKAEDLVSTAVGNQLGTEGNKLFVPAVVPSDLVSAESKNIITTSAEDQKLTVKTEAVQSIIENYLEENAGDLVSIEEGNIIRKGEDGKLFAKPEMLDYLKSDPNNLIGVEGNKMMVDKTTIQGMIEAHVPASEALISKDEGNYTTEGTDGGIYTPTPKAADFVSADHHNLIRISGNDKKLTLTEQDVEKVAKDTVTPESLVSPRPGNALGVDDSGGLFMPAVQKIEAADLVSPNEGNAITIVDNKLFVEQGDVNVADLVSEDEGNTLKLGSDAKLFNEQQASWTDADPGEGSPLRTGNILFVVEEA